MNNLKKTYFSENGNTLPSFSHTYDGVGCATETQVIFTDPRCTKLAWLGTAVTTGVPVIYE